ncbi:MAG: PKD domain-containing protein [Candidatus Poseidoniaceae archaeon]|nr:PKD domain-containing protein [Candidatus Poseidoniaceae archaeon]
MKSYVKPVLMALIMISTSLAGCIFDDDSDSEVPVTAVFSYSPTSNIRTGDSVELDGSASLPQDGSLTYSWDCDGDGAADETGQKTDCSWEVEGTYSVTLTVASGGKSNSQTKEITVTEAPVGSPKAEITQYADEEDCVYDDIDETKNILVWICAMDKSDSDREITDTTTIQLDGSDSESGGDSEYITAWNWDLDLEYDSDGDGNLENDADLTGEQVEWKDVAPGEYEVNLSVTNSAGAMDGDKIKVYVSYYGEWKDFQIDGNNSGSPKVIEFDMPVVYDRDQGNTIRKVEAILTYPQLDDDQFTDVENTLNLYAFNEEDEEASNTSDTANENRDEGDCDSDNYCVLLLLSSYMFMDTESTWDDGEWRMQIRNNRWNDVQVESMVIILHYK